MAISPEIRPRVSVPTDYEVPPMRAPATEQPRDRMERKPDNSISYVLAVLAIIAVGYFAYLYYGQGTMTPSATDQSTTNIVPPDVVPAPSATAPAAPTAPVTPPATTTTP